MAKQGTVVMRQRSRNVLSMDIEVDDSFIRTRFWRVPQLYEQWLAHVSVSRSTEVTEGFRFFRIPAPLVSLGLLVGTGRATCMIAGPMQKLHPVPPFTGGQVIGPIVLRSSAVHSLLGMPASELADQFIDAECIWGSWTRAFVEQVVQERTAELRVSRLLELLHIRIASAANVLAEQIFALAVARHGAGSVRELADASGYSERQLRRIFLDHVGVGPKDLGRMLRAIKALRGLATTVPVSWSSYAMAHGYYDQAHFIADFREVVGQTPKRFLEGLVDPRLLARNLAVQASD
jgi:AraC-like DNA-binding protein